MKRKLLVVLIGLSVLLLLVIASGPLLMRLGVQPFCIQTVSGRLRVVRCPMEPAELPELQAGAAPPLAAGARPAIIDTDMAMDDWMAILYLLNRLDVEVRAITVTGTGEAHCGPGTQHARDLAALAGRPEIPVACGRETPLQGAHVFPSSWRDWVDSLAGLSLPANPHPAPAQNAVQLLADILKDSPEKVTLITLGPLTNLAEAFQADPSLVGRLEMVYIMGGAFDVPGNVAPSGVGIDNSAAEWNIYIDPYATAVVLDSAAPLTFVPLDVTNQVPITPDFYERLEADRATPSAEFVYRVLTRQLDSIRSGRYWFWDPLTAAISTDESLGTIIDHPVTVIVDEGPQSGATRRSADGNPARVTTAVDRERFETLFLETLNGRAP